MAVNMQWPLDMSEDYFKDFTDWLMIQHRRRSRTVEGDKKSRIKLASTASNLSN